MWDSHDLKFFKELNSLRKLTVYNFKKIKHIEKIFDPSLILELSIGYSEEKEQLKLFTNAKINKEKSEYLESFESSEKFE